MTSAAKKELQSQLKTTKVNEEVKEAVCAIFCIYRGRLYVTTEVLFYCKNVEDLLT